MGKASGFLFPAFQRDEELPLELRPKRTDMQNNTSEKEQDKPYKRRMLRLFLMVLLFILVIFISAGRLTYWQGWGYGAVSVILFLISSLIFKDKTDLIRERSKPGPGTKWWDKIFFSLYIPMYLAIFMVGCLDAGRYGWSPQLPVSVYIISYLALFVSNSIIMWAMWTNTFFSSTVRIQTDRGHEVVRDGPYRFIRHPGYVGAILMPTSIALVLGSLWALIPAGITWALIIVRTHLEDITLQKELPGYSDYAGKVKYRLLPGIW